jgi:hypothetical protein
MHKVLLSLGVPLITALIWATFGAPGAKRRLSESSRVLLELVILGTAVILLYRTGSTMLAVLLAALIVINRTLMYVWKQ